MKSTWTARIKPRVGTAAAVAAIEAHPSLALSRCFADGQVVIDARAEGDDEAFDFLCQAIPQTKYADLVVPFS